jgi:hypothetical protein
MSDQPDAGPGPATVPERPRTIDDLEINEVRDGLIVYDATRDRVHYLNATASVVFTLCDGDHDASAMADEMADLFEVAPPRSEVDDCLASFATEGLLR